MHDDGVDGGTSDRVVGGDDLGASEAQPGSAGETCGQGDGGEPSGARDPRRIEAEIEDSAADFGEAGLSDFVPLTLTGEEPATNIQNEIVDDGPGEAVGSAPIDVVEGGRHEGGETGGQADAGNGDFPARLWAKWVVLWRLAYRSRFPSGRDDGGDVRWRGRSLNAGAG